MSLSKLLSLFRRSREEPERAAPSIPTVTFDGKQVTAAVRADVLSTPKGNGEIPKGKLPALNKIAIASVVKGRDLGMLRSAIMSSGIVGMTERRASEIARHVHNRATSLMVARKQTNSGIQEAVWLYSGAPCYPNAKAASPEQLATDAAHRAANGQRYRVSDGLAIEGKWVWPGQEAGCKCLSGSAVPGFS